MELFLKRKKIVLSLFVFEKRDKLKSKKGRQKKEEKEK